MKSNSEMVTASQKRKKQYFVKMFGGKCEICAYDKCVDAMDFHHADTTTKVYQPSYVIYRKPLDVAFEELVKCRLLCANCHREVHAGLTKVPPITRIIPIKCCIYCRKSFATIEQSTEFCSPRCERNYRGVSKPSKEELVEVLKINSNVQAGKLFKVSERTIRKWSSQYNIGQ